MEWTASNVEITSTEALLFESVTEKLLLHEDFTHLDLEKLWFRTHSTLNQSTPKQRPLELAEVSVDVSENKFIRVPMNSVFVSLTEGGIFNANYQPKALSS